LGELTDDLIRRMPPALIRCHVVSDSSCPNTRATESHNDWITSEGPPHYSVNWGSGIAGPLVGTAASAHRERSRSDHCDRDTAADGLMVGVAYRLRIGPPRWGYTGHTVSRYLVTLGLNRRRFIAIGWSRDGFLRSPGRVGGSSHPSTEGPVPQAPHTPASVYKVMTRTM
nr:hypothetical protein [Actinomycetes bacterium]